MNHRRLLRFALWMWAAPLVAGSLAFGGFLFMRSPLFAVIGLGMLVAGGLCLIAGTIAVIAVVATRNSFLESPRRYYKKPALAVLGLLLLNLPVAGFYGWVSAARLLEEPAIESVASPNGRYLAEVVLLDEHATPPYGQAVTLRPVPGLFWPTQRTRVFSGFCLKGPTPAWGNGQRLTIECAGAAQVGRRLPRYRDVTLAYRNLPAPAGRKRAPATAESRAPAHRR